MCSHNHGKHTAYNQNGNQQQPSAAEDVQMVHNSRSCRYEKHGKIGENKGRAVLDQLYWYNSEQQQYKEQQKPDDTAGNREMKQLLQIIAQ
ncbi:hypothetical protein D3C81_2074670 [compost metagenome]